MPAKPVIKVSSENKCDLCTGALCCQYITHEIETPRSKIDFEYLLWQVSHENIHIYKDEDGWYLLVMSPCTHLIQPGGRCAIYSKRPQICRDHTNDFCEYDQPNEEGFDLYFKDYSSLHRYCKKRFRKWLR